MNYTSGEDLSLKTFYDSLTNTIKTQAEVTPNFIPAHFQKVTETRQIATGTVIKNKQELQKQTVQTDNSDRQVERNSLPLWLIVMIVLVAISIFGWAVLKFKRNL